MSQWQDVFDSFAKRRDRKPYGFDSTLFQKFVSCPLPLIQQVLHAIVHVWQAMHLLMSNT